jgi:hypothetical protein
VFDEMLEAQNAGDAGRLRSMLSERPVGTTSGRSPTMSTFTSRVILPGSRGAGVSRVRVAASGRCG